jgi:hypothetical protein
VTLFGREDCPCTSDLRALFEELGVPFSEVVLGRTSTPVYCCGYTSPSVQIASGSRKPELLVRPSRADVLDALSASGELGRARGRGPR